MARIGRPDILWSVNKLARSITKWTKACDKRLNRLISYIHHTSEYKQYCHVGITAEQCRLGLFQDSDFAGDLEDSKSTSGGTLRIFGSHTFVPISWMCKKQTSVSHSSTESEIISLDTGQRLDGLPALELWDLIVSVLGNVSRVSDGSGKPESDVHKRQKSHNKIDVMKDIDLVPSNVQSANREALLYVFEDNEAVIKMIMKGRSPTMRHVSRTHRVALDWLFDRINLDTKIQIKYIDTKNQLADILTKGSFTRDEWNHLLTLFNISHFSSTACIAAMAKRAQQDSGEGRVTAKSRPMMNLTARTPSFVSCSASANPERSSYGYQDPEQPVLDDRAGKPVETSRSNYSQDYGSSWSSQVWKSGNGEHDRSGQPEKNSWDSLGKVDPHREEHLLGRTAHFKFGVEVRIQSMKEDNSHSWVRISYGTTRYVNNYIKYNTQSLADTQEEEYVPTSSGVVAARSKAKAKPQPRESTGTTTIPLSERVWIDIEPSKQNLESHNLSKKVINLLRHNQKLHREQDGAIQFYKIKFHLRDYPLPIQNWSDDRWLACLAAGGGPKRRYQYCSDYLGSIIYLRALQGHSGDSIIDLAMQDHVLIGPGVFPYIYHVGSNFNISSILSNGLILGGQNLSRRQSVFFLPVDPRDESHRDPENIDYSVPRRARYVQHMWKRHQDTVFWIDIDLGIIKEGLKLYQTRSNAIIFQGVLPASCIVRAERLKSGETLYERQYLSPRPPPKISLRRDLNWTKENNELGYTVEHRPVGKLVQQSLGENSSFRFFQANPISQNQWRSFGETRSSRDC